MRIIAMVIVSIGAISMACMMFGMLVELFLSSDSKDDGTTRWNDEDGFY